MAKFDNVALAVKAVYPTNEVVTDDKGLPGVYVRRASKTLAAIMGNPETSMKATKAYTAGQYISVAGVLYKATTAIASGATLTVGTNVAAIAGGSTIHPAFKISNSEKASLCFGKFQGVIHNNRLYSLPGEDPASSKDLDAFTTYGRNKGPGHHEITAAEWAFLALLAKRNGTQPWGNNNYGKDSRETDYIAIPKTWSSGQINHVATGTGPMKWSDDGTMAGIWDLNGNVSEWVIGVRLVYGELQVIPWNDAADPETALGASSAAWKAINAQATDYDDLFIEPNGSGTTANSVKLDYISSHWAWISGTISSASDSSRSATFASTTIDASISDFAALYLRAMALAPEPGDTDYEGDYFYANNGAAERCAYRGGIWNFGACSGVFCVNFNHPRSSSATSLGGRPAYYE